LSQYLATKHLRFGSKATPLLICVTNPFSFEVLLEHLVLFGEILDYLLLPSVHYASDTHQKKLPVLEYGVMLSKYQSSLLISTKRQAPQSQIW
jgi:hypothetical protein